MLNYVQGVLALNNTNRMLSHFSLLNTISGYFDEIGFAGKITNFSFDINILERTLLEFLTVVRYITHMSTWSHRRLCSIFD